MSGKFLRDKDSDLLGRLIPNSTHSAYGTPPPNHKKFKSIIAGRWGDVLHPNISDVARAIISFRAATPTGRIWDHALVFRQRPLVAVDHLKYGTLVSIPVVIQ